MKIIVDTREKKPWLFNHPDVTGVEIRKLRTGDYTVEELENVLCIERKKVVAEFATCVTVSRFKDELERMRNYKYRYLVFEFDEDAVLRYPVGSHIPAGRWSKLRVTGPYIMKFINEIREDYELEIVFAGDSTIAELKTIEIMKETLENERNKSTTTPHNEA
jgi:ERCC4-type nuclease